MLKIDHEHFLDVNLERGGIFFRGNLKFKFVILLLNFNGFPLLSAGKALFIQTNSKVFRVNKNSILIKTFEFEWKATTRM